MIWAQCLIRPAACLAFAIKERWDHQAFAKAIVIIVIELIIISTEDALSKATPQYFHPIPTTYILQSSVQHPSQAFFSS